MSVFLFESSWLSVTPRVWVEGQVLHAQTSLLIRALSLFSYSKRISVDRRAQVVQIESQWLWFRSHSRTIRTNRISHIEYRFSSIGTAWAIAVGRTDQLESFAVDLVIEGEPAPLPLFRFRGEGSVGTGLLGYALGDSLFDGQGTQESASRRFVEQLSKFTGASLGRPMPRLKDEAGRVWACSACSRPGPPRHAKCLYCGGDIKVQS